MRTRSLLLAIHQVADDRLFVGCLFTNLTAGPAELSEASKDDVHINIEALRDDGGATHQPAFLARALERVAFFAGAREGSGARCAVRFAKAAARPFATAAT
jgi:hypothetical protein